MSRRLIRHVHVFDDAGLAHEFAPGQIVPAWAAERITNPKVWEGSDDEASQTTGSTEPPIVDPLVVEPPPLVPGPESVSPDVDPPLVLADSDPSAGGAGPGEVVGVPPKAGPGSGKGSWQAYAARHDVDVAGMSRDQIIDALEAGGVPTE